ncbi:hypothetical protein DEJ46_10590 [Streptomyces venezuelae]|uniref:Uncharacterized protein n=1 Tax=Streptomyces venezuelae TaxID=54571 RepID=A0A5P2AMH4_STRVZ|nr:hypothetical protein DEJ46_10590 [Streptomyces venezuelae]
MDGVSTNLALIFGTLLSSQGADASFVLTLAGFPPGFSFVPKLIRCFPSDFLGAFRSLLFSLRGPFGGSDFIRSSESDFPPPGEPFRRTKAPGVPDLAEP